MQVEAAQAAKQKAEEQVGALRQSHKAEMEAEKSHYEALLQKARAAQVGLPVLQVKGICQISHALGIGAATCSCDICRGHLLVITHQAVPDLGRLRHGACIVPVSPRESPCHKCSLVASSHGGT